MKESNVAQKQLHETVILMATITTMLPSTINTVTTKIYCVSLFVN